MIFDTLDRADRYEALGRGIAAALRTLRETGLATQPDGRYELDGERLFAMVQTYDTRPPDACVWESHRRYIDVQFIVEGVEAMGHRAIDGCVEKVAYDAGRDVRFYHPPAAGEAVTRIVVPAGGFALFFPHDVHSPMIAATTPTRVKKVVLKVAVE